MYGYVYETTCLVNGKKYIGRHKSSKFDRNYIGSGVLFQRAVNKYGKSNFTVKLLEAAESEQELCLLECKYIKESNAAFSEDYYNLTTGGETTSLMGWGNKPHPNKGKRRPDMEGSNNPNHKSNGGLSQATRNKISEARKLFYANHPELNGTFHGKHHNEKTKKIMSKAKKGKVVVNDGVKLYWVYKHEVDYYLERGCKLGKINKTTSNGRVWMNNGVHNIYPKKEESDKFLSDGYNYGFISKKNKSTTSNDHS